MSKTKEKEKDADLDVSKKQVEQFLIKNKADHLNFEETVDWRASTGSLQFDAELGGGFGPGGYKVSGASFSGKTNCILNCLRNALNTVNNAKGLWFKAEGRLDQATMDRSGAKFVFKTDEWEVGTILVLESNIYEFTIDLINNLVKNNPKKYKFFFVIDSVDALIRRDDEKKSSDEGERVGAGGMLLSLLFKKAGLILNKMGHCLFAVSQIRAKVETNQYAPKDQNKSVGGGGSNALTHGVNQVWNFKGRTKSKNIEEKGEVVGHYCEIELSKGVKERIDVSVKYPIKHGQTNGNSVWIEYEILDMLLAWEFVIKSGSWLTLDEEITQELIDAKFDIPADFKIQGLEQFKNWLGQNPELTRFLYKKFLKMFCEN
jgi:RecA/RadA recombinase